MAIIDSKGRLFGKISLLDLGAACVMVLVIIGIFFVPGNSGSSIAQIASTKPIEVDVLVRGLSVGDPQALFTQFREEKSTSIIIRNQPYSQVKIIKVQELPRTVSVSQPDGSVKALSDPRPEATYSSDMILTLGGKAQITETGAVFGNQKVKIGTLIELDGSNYNFRGSVINVRL